MKQLFTLLLLLPAVAFSQYRITVILEKVPAKTTDRIFIAGNFNQWVADDENTLLSKGSDGKFTKVFEDIEAGEYEFKFTLGTMESVEVGADGKDIPNRILSLRSDTTIRIKIGGWKGVKTAFIENNSSWSSLPQPFYSLPARAKKPDGVISRSRQTLPKS